MEVLKNKPLFIFFLFVVIFVQNCDAEQSVRSFNIDYESKLSESHSLVRNRRDVTETESEREDEKCEEQKKHFSAVRDSLKDGSARLEETHVFGNESKFNLALAWAGKDDDGTLLVLTSEVHLFAIAESTLWRSTDHGRNWDNWNSHVDNQHFRKDDGLQRNPHNPHKVYLISYEHFLYVTEDGGMNWKKSVLTESEEDAKRLTVEDKLEFHPEPQFEDYILVVSNQRKLYVTYNNFQSKMTPIKEEGVHMVKWGAAETKTEKCLYATTGLFKQGRGPDLLKLERYNKDTGRWSTILERVFLFDIQGKFMYASVFKSEHPTSEEDDKLMMISSDGGNKWDEAQLPTLSGDRFFSVLDMTEGLIFMHVDNPGDTGHGTLYTSSNNGLVYAESLRQHLFPNFNTINDFYKVVSIRGVYLASQMSSDKSIHTVITYNRGGEWKNVSRPLGVPCENDESKGCFLQIHNAYSIHRGITAQLPHSLKEAYGLVLVHGHVAGNLQTSPPDVYLSTDGGYNFRKVLSGPHAYEITDSGGLLVAVPLSDPFPNTIKFSTDEGHCWHTYRFTDKVIRFTGLLTEPGGKSMTVSLWGYVRDTKKWTVNIIDFNKVVSRECKEEDYEPWTPHTSLSRKPGYEGCVLGQRETFNKIKKDSWCRNGYNKHMVSIQEICRCSEEDYECDYGFHRPDGSDKCVRQPNIKSQDIDICKGGHLEKLTTVGYRLIPGDVCDQNGGFKPSVDKLTPLNIICGNGDQSAIKHDTKAPPANTGSKNLLIGAIVAVIVIIVAVTGAFFSYKLVLLRRHKVVYRYSMLNQGDTRDDEFENTLISHDTLYGESSDEEVEQENSSPKRQANGNLQPGRKPQVKSFHDDSDDDMLN